MNTLLPARILSRALVGVAVALLGLGCAHAAELRVFNDRSFTAIRQAAADRPLVVAFWSTTCSPCAEEMSVFARLHHAYPSIKVVLVAADAPELRPKVERFLARFELGRIETWQFGDQAEERLRYSVDHAWRGELPRAYFFAADGSLTVQSGVPDEQWAADWFAQADTGAKKQAP
jgi:thiol-disulfide isomerase/thioredoxin